MEELEPRLLFSADLPGVLAQSGLLGGDTDSAPPAIVSLVGAPSVGAAIGNSEQTPSEKAFTLTQPKATATLQKELVFVDAGAPNYQQLINDLMKAQAEGRPIEVVVLESGRDGIEQITEAMAERRDVSAVHIVSHGSDGSLTLGNAKLNANNIEKYRDAIASWQASLTDGADLLLYGCDFAGSAQGREMVETLSSLTGADVAASTDRTGNESLGGDWELEYETGDIEAQIAFGSELQDQWMGSLTTYTVDTTADSGAGSLRWAITQANGNGGQDTIDFNIALNDPNHLYYQDDSTGGNLSPPVTTSLDDASISDFDPDFAGTPNGWYRIQVSTPLPNITDSLILDATTQPGYADSPVIEIDGSLTGAGDDGLNLWTSHSTVRGLVINNFNGDGIVVTGAYNAIAGNYIGTDVSGTQDFGNGTDGIYMGTATGNTIGGTSVADRNVISGNNASGINLESGSDNNSILGNYIGVDASGTQDLGNNSKGIRIDSSNSNIIGGSASGAGNVISGNNDDGITIRNNSDSNVIKGNLIGVDASGIADVGNVLSGIFIGSNSQNNIIGGGVSGEGNVIAYNDNDGILIAGSGIDGNTISGNSIYANGSGGNIGIDLNDDQFSTNDPLDGDSGPNELQNFPVLGTGLTTGTAITINGTFNSSASSTFRLEFFSNSVAHPSN